jgi:PilZ domain
MTKSAAKRQTAPELGVNDRSDAAGTMRRFPRYPTQCPATCSVDGFDHWAVVIVDASQGGFGLSRDLPVPRGTHVIISIPQIGDFLCAIAWKKAGRCGVELASESGWLTDDEAKRLAGGLDRVETAGRRSGSPRSG